MSANTEPVPQILIDDLDALKTYFDPVRKRLMQELVPQALTIQELADRLNVPFTRLYYHLNLLEKHNFVHVVETRPGPGFVEEKVYRATAWQYVIASSLLRPGAPDSPSGLEIVLATVLDATKADIVNSMQTGLIEAEQIPPHPRSMLLRRGVLRLRPEVASRMYERLIGVLVEFLGQQTTDGQAYGVVVGLYPSHFSETPVSPEDLNPEQD